TQRFCHQGRSNIVQRIKNTIHSEFSDLVKPKTGNRQVMHEEERKFKEADITKESYLKLNQPVDANDNPHYTYLNLIIDRTFADPNTEKNSIAFGIAVALNYHDPSKGISMVPSEVAERMNHILEKMQVSDCEEL
ncbi:13828_t:CDS:1, partial [Cetraspora pellucida]